MSGILMASVGNSYGSAPVNTVAPAVTGTATFGSTLTTTNGTWTGAPAPTFTYQWFRSPSTSISGATSTTYVLVAADVGFGIFCQVRATNSVAPSGVTANSNTTATVAAVVPGAPTIGTATSTGTTTATVAYTAPASDGGATITLYTATSSPSGITGTLSQAGSGTITVSGLSAGTSYTFTVRATNSAGQSAASAASNSITTSLPAIGAAFGGGFYAGQIGVSSTATHNLIVGPKSTAQGRYAWKTTNTSTAGTSSDIDGPTNSSNMNNASHPAAQFCEGLTIGGFSDWYMPAKNELEVCYFNLKPTTATNNTSSGTNPNAVPARGSNYTSGNPAQTSASDFKDTGAEDFDDLIYWNSTQYDASDAWVQNFSTGNQYNNGKTFDPRVRAVRRVAV
jgi:hypothetical protein